MLSRFVFQVRSIFFDSLKCNSIASISLQPPARVFQVPLRNSISASLLARNSNRLLLPWSLLSSTTCFAVQHVDTRESIDMEPFQTESSSESDPFASSHSLPDDVPPASSRCVSPATLEALTTAAISAGQHVVMLPVCALRSETGLSVPSHLVTTHCFSSLTCPPHCAGRECTSRVVLAGIGPFLSHSFPILCCFPSFRLFCITMFTGWCDEVTSLIINDAASR